MTYPLQSGFLFEPLQLLLNLSDFFVSSSDAELGVIANAELGVIANAELGVIANAELGVIANAKLGVIAKI